MRGTGNGSYLPSQIRVDSRGSRTTPYCDHKLFQSSEGFPMRVMVIVKATKDSEEGLMPTEQMFSEMLAYNDQLVKAGIMLAGDGLHPSIKGKRVRFDGAKRTVIDGPFAETKELIAGYWIWQVRSM